MKKMRLEDLKNATGGKILATKQTQFSGVGTDTRQDLSNQIFFALRGENFDAHEFLEQAVQKKAQALVVDCQPSSEILEQVSVVLVSDTLKALQDWGHWWRKHQKAKIIALTGSNGKTTTKEFTATLLSQQFKTWASHGSFNNHWGVPLTLLQIEDETEMAVVEMGMNHPGEIAQLVQIAEPEIVAVTMVGRAHIEAFGSEENIAKAKAEIYETASKTATRVFNLDNRHTRAMWEKAKGQFPLQQICTFSIQEKADVQLQIVDSEAEYLIVRGQIGGIAGEARVEIFGEHNVTNLAAAAALALSAGVTPQNIWQGFTKCNSGWGRNQWLHMKNGARILFDAYNANPDSMGALLKNVSRIPVRGRKFAVFGDMRELGGQSQQLHEQVGELAAGAGLDFVWFIGQFGDAFERGLESGGFKKTFVKSAVYEQKLALDVASMLNPTDIVIVKGSRGVRLEQVVAAWGPVDFQNKH